MTRPSLFPLGLMTVMLFPSIVWADQPTGKELYETYCTQCHGMIGDGWGVNTRDIAVLPRDHTETDEMSARTDEDLFKAIKFGGAAVSKSILMPNWDANMTDDEIRRTVSYLRELCQCSAK